MRHFSIAARKTIPERIQAPGTLGALAWASIPCMIHGGCAQCKFFDLRRFAMTGKVCHNRMWDYLTRRAGA